MMAPYEGTLRVQITAIVADDDHGFVRVTEIAGRPTQGLAWTGVHVWGFRNRKIARFESYYDDAYADFWSGRSASHKAARYDAPRAWTGQVHEQFTPMEQKVADSSGDSNGAAQPPHAAHRDSPL
jgi:hypothetical protein